MGGADDPLGISKEYAAKKACRLLRLCKNAGYIIIINCNIIGFVSIQHVGLVNVILISREGSQLGGSLSICAEFQMEIVLITML